MAGLHPKPGIAVILLSLLFALASPALQTQAQSSSDYLDTRKKTALIVSVGSYDFAHHLTNPLHDGNAVAERLEKIGFKVRYAPDATEAEAKAAIDAFEADAADSDVALFYYSGHGVQVDSDNYAVPRDFDPDSKDPLPHLISISKFVKDIDGIAKAKVFLLDACRDNPIAEQIAAALPGRSVGRGLAPINVDRTSEKPSAQAYGLIVGYATQANNTASDGDGVNSPYAGALLKAIASPDEDFGSILIRVAGLVASETGGAQKPEFRVALSQPLYLVARTRPLDCDVLAGEQDNNVSVPGVEFDLIDVPRAVAACRADLTRFPDNPRLIHNLARSLDKGGMKQEAVELYEKAAGMGFAWSQNNLSVMYLQGEGVQPDMAKALHWMRIAYRQANRQARTNYTDTDISSLFEGSPKRTAALQTALLQAGVYAGEIGQQFDQKTKAAAETYKEQHSIKGEGITFQLLDALGITDAVLQREANKSSSAK